MSYCRFGEGDVYLYPSSSTIVCCMCLFEEEDEEFQEDVWFSSRLQALEHLRQHQVAGHVVPQFAIERLERELRDVGDDASLNLG